MSLESRQRERAKTRALSNRPCRKDLGWLILFLIVVIVLPGILWKSGTLTRNSTSYAAKQPTEFRLPATFSELCNLSTNEVHKVDIALMNLLCAEGLPGAEHLNVKECLERIDGIAKHVQFETDRHLYKYLEHPEEFNRSLGYYRMMMLATVLQQDLGIHYNPERIRLPSEPMESSQQFFVNSQDVLIHGLTREQGMGTCSSMPVFFVAVGRRLSYPLKLVKAKCHMFARWDEEDKSFNIEGTSLGFVSHPDSYYRAWPFPFSPAEAQTEGYLKPMAPLQELAVFLSIRGECLRASGDYLKALGAYAQASYKDGPSVGYQKLFARAEWEAAEAGVLPKRQALLIQTRHLVIPDGPMREYLIREKARLQAMLMAGTPEDQVETDLEILKVELASHLPSLIGR